MVLSENYKYYNIHVSDLNSFYLIEIFSFFTLFIMKIYIHKNYILKKKNLFFHIFKNIYK